MSHTSAAVPKGSRFHELVSIPGTKASEKSAFYQSMALIRTHVPPEAGATGGAGCASTCTGDTGGDQIWEPGGEGRERRHGCPTVAG